MNKAEAAQVFDGILLSDGGISRGPPYSVFYMRLSGEEHVDWLEHIKGALETLGVEVSATYPKLTKRVSYWGKPRDDLDLKSHCSPFLCSQRRRWYPNGAKEVPEDFTPTPIVLANEFMGDGSSHRDARHPVTVGVFLHTQKYSLRSIEVLEKALRSIEINSTRAPVKKMKAQGSRIRILLLQDSVDRFMTMVEPYILPSYAYKLKWRGVGKNAQVQA